MPEDIIAPKSIDYGQPQYENGVLTRAGMEQVLAGGGGVSYGNTIITSLANLPTEAQLAQGDKVKMARAAENIAEQIKALQSQLVLAHGGSNNPDSHLGHTNVVSIAQGTLPGGLQVGTAGEGDTAGADGDRGNPEDLAGQLAEKEREQAEAKLKADTEARGGLTDVELAAAHAREQLRAEAEAAAKAKMDQEVVDARKAKAKKDE